MEYKIDDYVLRISDNSDSTLSVMHKYDAFLSAFTTDNFEHIRQATRKAIQFFVTPTFTNTEEAAIANYDASQELRTKYEARESYLEHFRIRDKKSCSIDLATGTGKSWLIYAVAQIMLAEGLVDKVLVLCPSLTIEDGLKQKFERFSGDQVLSKILMELESLYPSPAIKSANDPILNGDICVENIHAAYERTGSSIEDSFKGKGQRTLVISDEAHHIYSDADSDFKKWYKFLTDGDYDFRYLLGVTGTPYIENEYFHDVIYRYSLRQAMDDAIVKKIDYKKEEEYTKDKGFHETYANHVLTQKKYSGVLKPITIIVTDKIVTCVQVWNDLVKFLAKQEGLPYEEAAKKAIWVTSGIPSNKDEKKSIESIVADPEKLRKANLAKLKVVDESDNEVEWIVSVSMLTEGWDVKNVFQIVPHEQRAFNSKLLIAQVLGRGLRIPQGVHQPVFVKINNHEKWTEQIENLYREVLEIQNRVTWKVDPQRTDYLFPLYNLHYESVQQTIEIKEKPASAPERAGLSPQSKRLETSSVYSASGTMRFALDRGDIIPIDQAVREVKLFLKSKDESISKRFTQKKIRDFIAQELSKAGQEISYISLENLAKIKQAFGPMFRETGKPTPRLSMRPDSIFQINIADMPEQSFNEAAIRRDGYVFYDDRSLDSLSSEQKRILGEHLKNKSNYEQLRDALEAAGQDSRGIEYLDKNIKKIDSPRFKTALNLVYVSHFPEYRFATSLFENVDLIDSFIKSPDKGFYSLPYSYKPTEAGSSHVQNEDFNPDFFLKFRAENEILVVEMKSDDDLAQKNRAKLRDGSEHFDVLNQKLQEKRIKWKYHFYFLSPEDIAEFFQAVREGRHEEWKSNLMQELS